MTYEQPASLNRFVAEPMPLNWVSRWKLIRFYLPLLAFTGICLVETVGFKLWKRDELELSRLWPAFLLPFCLLAVIFITNEIRLRTAPGTRRFLNVLEKGTSVYESGRPLIRWSKVVAFWFEDIPDEPQFSKVTMEYFGDRKTKLPRHNALALDKRIQCPALLSELKLLQQQHNLNFRIELNQPLPPRREPRNLVLGMSLYLAGMLFLMPGIPVLLVPLLHRPDGSHHSESTDEGSPQQKAKFYEFLGTHFSSKTQLKNFMLVSGGVLTTIGIALMVWSIVVQRPKPENTMPASQSK